MTVQLAPPAPCTEFPTLDLAELDQAPLRPAVYLSTVEHNEFPAALAVALPTVVHAARRVAELASAISAVGNWNRGPSHEQLQQRRQQPGELHRQAVQRRGEYTGGPVDWITGRPLNSDDLAA